MIINDGIITDLGISGIKFFVDLIPISNTTSRPQYKMRPLYITVHNTGNSGVGAKEHTQYVDNVNGYVSWHFTIGNNEIYQELPINESAWHAGDGQNGNGNRKSIGIEICEVEGAEETAIKFIAALCVATGIKIENVVPHKFWSGKNCPRLILPHWAKFICKIKGEIKKMTETRYNKIEEMPEWLQKEMKPLVDKGIITGKSTGLDLSEDMCRTIIFIKRMIK